MKRIENPEIKQYLEDFAISTLSDCELFTKTFGKNFAKKRLKLNLDKVYTNETNKILRGYYDFLNKFIILCTDEENDKLLTSMDIEENTSLQETILHESVHAILNKTNLECLYSGVLFSTGIQEMYFTGNELGRGLNEGLTQWICGKAGYFSEEYVTLTNFINELELAIGEKRVMKMGKGNISSNISKQLEMSPKECRAFLALADEIYNLQKSVNELCYVINTLEDYQKIDELPEEEKDIIKGEYTKLKQFSIFNSIISSNNINLQDAGEVENQTAVFEKMLEEKESQIIQDKSEFESLIFAKYFQAEFEELKQMDDIPANKLVKFDDLYSLISKEEVTEDSVIGQFKRDYEKVLEKHFENICTKAKEEFEEGTLSGSKIEELQKIITFDSNNTDWKFFNRIAQLACPDEPLLASKILIGLALNQKLNTLNQYSIVKLGIGDLEINACQKNDKVVSALTEDVFIPFDKNDEELDEKNIELDFALEMDEDDKAIINQFLELRDKIRSENPQASIKISNRLIIIDDNNKQSFYLISHGLLLPLINLTPEPIRLNIAPNKIEPLTTSEAKHSCAEEAQYPTIYKKNIFSKLFMFFKQKSLKNTNADIHDNVKKGKNPKKDFKHRICDMSQYSEDTNINNAIPSSIAKAKKENQAIDIQKYSDLDSK